MRTRPGNWAVAARGGIAVLLAGVLALYATGQQPSPEPVGTLRAARATLNGQRLEAAVQRLESGNDVQLDGYAKIELVEGGEIHACGPANFRVLKSGAAITIAVNSGRLRAVLDDRTAVTFYTPFISATPIAIGDDPREAILALEGGAMCVQAARGALRLENQFTGETLVVPQAGEFFLRDGQLVAARQSLPACTCQPPPEPPRPQLAGVRSDGPPPAGGAPPRRVFALPMQPARPAPDESVPPTSELPPAPLPGEPVWTVVMPPLRFDASAPEPPPEADPQFIVLIQQVRVEPALVFRGVVQARTAPPALREPARSGNPLGRFFRWLLGLS
ncbi:MAG: hypothetical protein K6U09_10200 [Acidobacteriia bacterium]|nr:hypothetical protein [Terriglobia bacterium]